MWAIVFALPYFVGKLLEPGSVSLTYLCGQLMLWATFQVVAVLCINFRTSFNALFWIYTILAAALTGSGIYAFLRDPPKRSISQYKHRQAHHRKYSLFFVIALLIIAAQMCMYIFGVHLDEDDARWIAEANDALAKNRMLLNNPATGEYIGRFVGEMIKDVFSPWCMYLAWLSRATGIRTAAIAHTIYPPILLGLSYSAYYEIGSQLFAGKRRIHERGIFLLMVSIINLFMGGNVYTQSVFTLTRIWQGKAVVAAVMIPVIMMAFLRIQKPRTEARSAGRVHSRTGAQTLLGTLPDWQLLLVVGTACCLFSGFGIAIGLIMIGVYGAYVAARMIVGILRAKTGEWRGCAMRIGMWIAAMAPPMLYGMGYLWLKG